MVSCSCGRSARCANIYRRGNPTPAYPNLPFCPWSVLVLTRLPPPPRVAFALIARPRTIASEVGPTGTRVTRAHVTQIKTRATWDPIGATSPRFESCGAHTPQSMVLFRPSIFERTAEKGGRFGCGPRFAYKVGPDQCPRTRGLFVFHRIPYSREPSFIQKENNFNIIKF